MKIKSTLIAFLCCIVAFNSHLGAEDFFEGLEGEVQEESSEFEEAEEIPFLDFKGDKIKDVKGTCFPAGRFTKSQLEADLKAILSDPDGYEKKLFSVIWRQKSEWIPDMLVQIKGWAECLGGHEKTFQKSNEGTSTKTFHKGIERLNKAYGSVLKMVKKVYPPHGNTRFANYDFAKGVGKLEGIGSVSVRRDLAAHLVDKISASKSVKRGASSGHIKYHRTDDLIQMIKGDDGSLAIIESEMNASVGIDIPGMWEAILFNTCRAKGKNYVYGTFSPYGDCPKHDPKEAHKVVGEIIGHISKSAGENASQGNPKTMKAQAYFLGKIVGHMEKGFLVAREKLAKTEREKIAFGFNIVKYSLKVVRQFTPAAAHSALDRVQEAADKLYKYELNQEKIDKKELRNLMELVFKAVNIGFHSALQGDSFESRMTGSYEFQSSLEEGRGSTAK